MIVSAFFALAANELSLPANLMPASEQELFLSQTFYELDDSSRAEQHEFRLNQTFSIEKGGPVLTQTRWLAGWIIGDIRLDDPIKPAPLVTKWEMNKDGTFKYDGLKDFQVQEFRIDRLRWFFPPKTRIQQNGTWEFNLTGIATIHVPSIQFEFKLEKSQKDGDSTIYDLSVAAKELDSSVAIMSEGRVEIRVVGNTYRITSGQWTTPSAPMIGNNSDRFKLVQTLKEFKLKN